MRRPKSDRHKNMDTSETTNITQAKGQIGKITCVCCGKTFPHSLELKKHELKAHFAWTIKSYDLRLKQTLNAIIENGCITGQKFGLREKLNAALDEFENYYDEDVKCTKCSFVTRSRDDLVQHFKQCHIPKKNHLQHEYAELAIEGLTANQESNEDAVCDDQGHDDELSSKESSQNTLPEEEREDDVNNNQDPFEYVEMNEIEETTKEDTEDRSEEARITDPHQEMVVTGVSNNVCGYCKRLFKDSLTLSTHVMAQHFPDSKCNMCEFELKGHSVKTRRADRGSRAAEMRLHMMTKHRLTLCGRRGHPCPHCQHICLSRYNLNHHRQRKHPEKCGNKARLSCSMCTYTFDSQSKLESHVKRSHKRTFKCHVPVCQKLVIGSKAALARHQSETVYHVALCQTCGLPVPPAERREGFQHQCPAQFGPKRFENGESFKFSGLEDGSKLCHLCGFTCSKEYTMLRHKLMMHRKQKCPSETCNVTVADRLVLQAHIRSRHKDMCTICAHTNKDSNGHNCVEHLLLPPKDGPGKLSSNAMIAKIDPIARPGACGKCFGVFVSTCSTLKHMKECGKEANTARK